jgi:hypothetical protein
MSNDIRRRIIRLEQADNQVATQYDVSDCPLEELESDLGEAITLSPILTEEEWSALYCASEA